MIRFFFIAFFFSSMLCAQENEPTKFGFGFTVGYQFLQPVFSQQSTQTLGPLNSINRGGLGFVSSFNFIRNLKWQFFISASIDFASCKISEILVLNESGQNSSFSITHNLIYLIPNFSLGRYFYLGKKIKTSLNLSIGYAPYVGKKNLTTSAKIYDASNDAHNYYEYERSYSRPNPIAGGINAKVYFPLKKKEIALGGMLCFSDPTECKISMSRVVGFEFKKIAENTSFLLVRGFSLSLEYRF